MHRSTVMSYEI